MMLERRLEVNNYRYMVFIDLEEAFDRVDWKLLSKVLVDYELDWRDKLILYKQQNLTFILI